MHSRRCNLSVGIALNVRFTTNRMCAKNNTHIYVAQQARIEWSWHVISIVACCHSVKLWAVHLLLMLSGYNTDIGQSDFTYVGGFQTMGHGPVVGHDTVFSGPQSFSTINSITTINSKFRVTTFLSLSWWNLQPYIKHYCGKMLQIWTISVKQFQINFSIQWQC